MKLKGLYFADVAEIQEAVTDELKKVQKEEFSADFQKLCDRAKPVHMLMRLRFKKKSVLKIWTAICVCRQRPGLWLTVGYMKPSVDRDLSCG